MIRLVSLLFSLLLTVLGQPAFAALIDVKYCVTYNLDYTDGETGDFLTDTTTPAIGAKLQLERSGGGIEWIYLDWEGADAGCGWFYDLSVGSTETFNVRLIRQASVNGNNLQVWTDDSSSGILYSSLLATGHHPNNGIGYNYWTGPSDSIHILAAASFAASRATVATDRSFVFYTEACPVLGGSCYQPNNTYYLNLYMLPSLASFKFVVAHELGHAVSTVANGMLGQAHSYNADLDGCNVQGNFGSYDVDGHYMNSKEYQSASAVEGFADFYAAFAFNDSTESDCTYEYHLNIDWNSNGVINSTDEPKVFSCEFGVPSAGVDLNDYLGDFCLTTGHSNNRGTEYDWLRHLWDLSTDYGYSPDCLFSLWDEADPHNWNATGNSTGNNYPEERMHDAALTVASFAECSGTSQTDYDTSASGNGTWR